MVLAALLALVSGWTIGAPPAAHELVAAEQRAGERVTRYARTRRDPDDAPVVLTAYDPGRSPYPAPSAPQTTVRGRPAEFSDLTDDGRTYGRALRWTEPSGVTLSLELASRPGDERLRAIAESVREEPPERWRVLRIAVSDPPELGRLPAGMKRVIVRRGRIAGRRFTLTALLPPGFPVAPEDRRAACYRLTFRGERSYGVSCGFETSWWRLGGTVFAFGSVAPGVRRVRVSGEGVDAGGRTGRARGYPLASFYAVPLPSNACAVTVEDADRGTDIGQTGPLPSGPRSDYLRCR